MSNSTPKAHSVSGLDENKVRFFRRVLDLLIQDNFIVIFLVLVIVASLLSADFLTIQNVANLFQQATIVGVVAVRMTGFFAFLKVPSRGGYAEAPAGGFPYLACQSGEQSRIGFQPWPEGPRKHSPGFTLG